MRVSTVTVLLPAQNSSGINDPLFIYFAHTLIYNTLCRPLVGLGVFCSMRFIYIYILSHDVMDVPANKCACIYVHCKNVFIPVISRAGRSQVRTYS